MNSSLLVVVVEQDKPGFKKKLLGLSLLGRMLNELALAGRKEITVVSEVDPAAVRGLLGAELLPSLQVRYVDASPEKSAFQKALALGQEACKNLIVLPADRVLSKNFIRALLEAPHVEAEVAAMVPEEQDASRDGQVVRLADSWLATAGPDLPGRSEVERIARPVRVSGWYAEVEPKSREQAVKKKLLQGLRKPVEIDGIICYYLMRPVTLRLTGVLADTFVLPNHVTFLTLLLGLVGVFLVGLGEEGFALVGSGLYFMACYLDCLDGELARIKYKMSYLGAWLDTWSDDVQTFFFIGALGLYLAKVEQSSAMLAVSVFTMTVYALTQGYIYHQLHTVYHTGDLVTFRFAWEKDSKTAAAGGLSWLKYFFKRDFFTLLFFVLFLVKIPTVTLILLFLSCTGLFVATMVHAYLTLHPTADPSPTHPSIPFLGGKP